MRFNTTTFYKKTAILGFLIFGANIANADNIKIDSYGHLGAIYNQEFSGGKNSTIALTARAGADFYFDNGISIGLGAAGAWAAWDKNGNTFGENYISGVYPNTGDVSSAYFKYNALDWIIALGRYDADFLDFDWISGNTQGVGFKYNNIGVRGLDLWVTYFNSILSTGYQPNRIASELGTFYAYHPGGRKSFVGSNGGNVVAGGVNYKLDRFSFDPFLLFNTSIPSSNTILLQLGLRFGFDAALSQEWYSKTQARFMLQYAKQNLNKYSPMLGVNNDDFGILLWGDQEFGFQDWLKFGAGFHFVFGQGIWSINDNSRFYGRWVNAMAMNYFGADMYSFYAFGQFKLINERLSIDVLLAGGNYTEISAVANYKLWQARDIKIRADIGGGYVHSIQRNGYDGGHLIIFAKLAY